MAVKDVCSEFLRYDFKPEEILEMGKELARKSNDLQNSESRKKAVMAQIKQEIDRATADIAVLSMKVANGYEHRDVECKLLWHTPRVGYVTLVREDTGEVIRERVMKESERQELLPFEAPEKVAPVAPTTSQVRGRLLEIGEDIAIEVIDKWTDEQKRQAEAWAVDMNNLASDPNAAHPDKPRFFKGEAEADEQDEQEDEDGSDGNEFDDAS